MGDVSSTGDAAGVDDARVRDALARLPVSIGLGDGAVLRQLGGLTNRVYEVTDGRESWVLRVPGPGVGELLDRAAERHNAEAAARLGVAPEVVHMAEADGVMLTRWVDGEELTPARLRDDPRLLARVAETLGGLHRSGVRFRGRFDPLDRIDHHVSAVRGSGARVPREVDSLVPAAENAWSAVAQTPPSVAPCHNDPWPSNFIDDDGRLFLVDWEYSAMGDPVWDLANVSVGADLDHRGDCRLVEAYGPVSPDETIAAIGRLKPVCDLLWGAWALAQHAAGNRSIDYRAYAAGRIDRAREAFARS